MKIDFGHITQIIVAIIGLVGILYANRQQKIIKRKTKIAGKEQKFRIPSKYIWVFWISMMLICTNLALFGWRLFINDYTHIEIIYPSDGSQVPIDAIVKGKSANVPKNKMIWVIVYSFFSGKHFPSQNPAQIDNNGNWTSPVIIGSAEDYGKAFTISTYLIDEMGRNEIEKELAKLDFSGLEALPFNMQLYHRISVYRLQKEKEM